MLPYFSEHYGNPSSRSHVFGLEAHRAVEEARAEVAALVGASAEEITFTSGATESDNLAVRGIARAAREPGRHLLTTTIEHSAVLEPCRTLEREGFAVSRVKVRRGGLVPVEGRGRRGSPRYPARFRHGGQQRGGNDPAGRGDRSALPRAWPRVPLRRRPGPRPDSRRRQRLGRGPVEPLRTQDVWPEGRGCALCAS